MKNEKSFYFGMCVKIKNDKNKRGIGFVKCYGSDKLNERQEQPWVNVIFKDCAYSYSPDELIMFECKKEPFWWIAWKKKEGI